MQSAEAVLCHFTLSRGEKLADMKLLKVTMRRCKSEVRIVPAVLRNILDFEYLYEVHVQRMHSKFYLNNSTEVLKSKVVKSKSTNYAD